MTEASLLFIETTGSIYGKTFNEKYCDTGDKDALDYTIAIEKMKLIGDILSNLIWFFIVGTMVMMYKRYLAPMTVEEKTSMSRKLVSIFSISRSQTGSDDVSETESAENDLVRQEEKR